MCDLFFDLFQPVSTLGHRQEKRFYHDNFFKKVLKTFLKIDIL